MNPVLKNSIIIVVAAIAAFAGFKWWEHRITTAPVGVYTQATVAPEVKLIPKVVIHPKAVKVYAPAATAHLKIPESMKGQSVLAASEVKSDPHPTLVVTTIDPVTGDTNTITRRESYPWLAAEQTGEVRVAYGFRGREQIARIMATEDLVQIKGVNLGLLGTLDSDGQHFAGIGVGYRW